MTECRKTRGIAMGRLARVLGWAARLFGLVYLAALFLWAVGTFGWFGQERDPLAGVFLLPLGVPWVALVEGAFGALAAPFINLILLLILARWARRRVQGEDA